eukprot:gene44026-53821_t
MEYDDDSVEYAENFATCSSVLFINEHERCQKWIKLLLKIIQDQTHQEHQQSDTESTKTSLTANKANNGISLKARHHIPSPAVKIDTRLHTLQLVNSHVKDVSLLFDTLFAFPKLMNLNLSFNSLRDVPSLLYCNMLQIVDVSHNRLQSLDFLLDCVFLRVLRCHHNNIESLMPLENHTKLEEVWISNNKVDWTQLMYLHGCKELRILVKSHNPCDEKAKCNEFTLSLLPSLHWLDGQQTSDMDAFSHRHAEDVDVKVMLTQARAQLKRDHSSQNLAIEMSLQGDNMASERSRSHSAKASRGMSRAGESDHSQTPDGRHSASSNHKTRHTTSSLKHLQKKQSNSTHNLHQHFEEEENEAESAGVEGLGVNASKMTISAAKPTGSENKKKSISSKHANKSLADVNTDLDQ